MEEPSCANGSAQVRLHTHTHTHTLSTPILCLPTTTVQHPAVLFSQQQDPGVPPPHPPPLSLSLSPFTSSHIPERAHAYRIHFSISASLCPIHLCVCVCIAAFAHCVHSRVRMIKRTCVGWVCVLQHVCGVNKHVSMYAT